MSVRTLKIKMIVLRRGCKCLRLLLDAAMYITEVEVCTQQDSNSHSRKDDEIRCFTLNYGHITTWVLPQVSQEEKSCVSLGLLPKIYDVCQPNRKPLSNLFGDTMAYHTYLALEESVRFELTEHFCSSVFKTDAINQTLPTFHVSRLRKQRTSVLFLTASQLIPTTTLARCDGFNGRDTRS